MLMKLHWILFSVVLSWVGPEGFAEGSDPLVNRPNIVLIYADDIGYGDLGCYGATKVKTPHLDRLAANGIRHTDAHSASATCTPSRYAMITGEYAWRKKGTGVLPGDAKLIIEPGRPTFASVLKQAGYATGVVGKWHVGLGQGPAPTDWNGSIRPGPQEIGFDSAFLMPATGDRVPCVYLRDDRVVGLDPADPIRVSFAGPIGDEPTGKARPDLLKVRPSHGHDMTIINGISRIGYMTGGKSARWVDENMADDFTREAVGFIERNKNRPFCLYFATHDIHVPRVPHPRFAGKSECGTRGDVIQELDWCVGEVVATLKRLDLLENTLLMFTSDNGPVVDDGYQDGAVRDLNGHKPAGGWRGGKYSAFEGGTRVPWIVHWPARVQPGVSRALISQVDLIATLGALVDATPALSTAPDSKNILPALLGESAVGRDHLVEHAGVLSIRQGPWKLIEPGRGARVLANTNTETGQAPEARLFHLDDDPAESRDLASRQPEQVRRLTALLEKIRKDGRSP